MQTNAQISTSNQGGNSTMTIAEVGQKLRTKAEFAWFCYDKLNYFGPPADSVNIKWFKALLVINGKQVRIDNISTVPGSLMLLAVAEKKGRWLSSSNRM